MSEKQMGSVILMLVGVYIAIGGTIEGTFGIVMFLIGGITLVLGAWLGLE